MGGSLSSRGCFLPILFLPNDALDTQTDKFRGVFAGCVYSVPMWCGVLLTLMAECVFVCVCPFFLYGRNDMAADAMTMTMIANVCLVNDVQCGCPVLHQHLFSIVWFVLSSCFDVSGDCLRFDFDSAHFCADFA